MGLLDNLNSMLGSNDKNVFAATPRKTNPAAYAKWIGGKLIDEAGNVVMEAPGLDDAGQAINSFMPVTGDIQSGLLAANDIKNKDYKSAALNSLGLLPFVPSMAGMIKSGKIADVIRPLTKFEQAHKTAQTNAVKMLGLPPNNTAMDRANVLSGLQFNTQNIINKTGLKKLLNEDVVLRAHKVGDIEFKVMPIKDFNNTKNTVSVYKSPVYNNNQSSEYRLGIIDNEPVYMRKANHWGDFQTNIKENTPIGDAMSQISKQQYGDNFGRMGKSKNNWKLKGSKNELELLSIQNKIDTLKNSSNKDYAGGYFDEMDKLIDEKIKLSKGSQAGYVKLSDLRGRLPEKINVDKMLDSEGGGAFNAQLIEMKNGLYRSPFAAFDPARVNKADLLGYSTPEMMGLLAAGSAGGIAYAYDKKNAFDFKPDCVLNDGENPPF